MARRRARRALSRRLRHEGALARHCTRGNGSANHLSHHHEYSSDELRRLGSGAVPMYQQLDGQSGARLRGSFLGRSPSCRPDVPTRWPTSLGAASRSWGFKAGHLVQYCGPRNLNDPSFFPYYEAAIELNVPLFCHPNTNGELIDRFDDFFAMHVLGRPINCTAALVALTLGGVFEKFPELRVVLFECGAEWILYWMHRMDDDYAWLKEEAKHLTMAPSAYLKRNCYVTCEVDEKPLPLAIEEFGAERICLATDFPHFDCEYPPHRIDTQGKNRHHRKAQRTHPRRQCGPSAKFASNGLVSPP